MRNPHAIFAAPFFIEKIDLDKVNLVSENFQPTFLSDCPTTLGHDKFTDESYEYVKGLIAECIQQFIPDDFVIGQAWRNKYGKHDWQDPHIHSGSQWSFVIVESVDHSRTVFMNPSRKLIMNQWAMYGTAISMDFIPNAPAGSIIIFPSWIEHFVKSGGEGTTISGNIYLTEPPRGPNQS